MICLTKLMFDFGFFRLKVIVEYFKMALDCFFAVWFVVGNVWIFGGHSSAAEAPNLYRYIVLLSVGPNFFTQTLGCICQ